MAISRPNARLRAQSTCAKIWRTVANSFAWLKRSLHDPRQSITPINDHIAQDIGLTAADLEWSRLELPSQKSQHPYG